MSIVAAVSMKGGVGKTTVAANLACALAAKMPNAPIHALDLDPQNALLWHLGVHELEQPGVAALAAVGEGWLSAARPSAYGVECLPYGDASEAQRRHFESALASDPQLLPRELRRAHVGTQGILVIDTPPGPSVYLKQVFACADLVLAVLLADAGSYATIPAMETWLSDAHHQRKNLRSAYLMNQVDRGEALNRDTLAFLRQQLGPRMCPVVIHTDESAAEALAFQQPVLAYEPNAQSSLDFDRLADWTLQTLGR